MIRLDRYVAGTLLGAIGMVMGVLLVLGALITFIDEQGSVGVGHYTMDEALIFSLLNIPRFLLTAFPAGVLIGAMLGIGSLARSHELTAMRCGGMSKWRLAATLLGCGVLLMGVALAMGEYLAPRLEQLANERRALARFNNVSLAGAGGAWIPDGNRIINIAKRDGESEYGGMLIFELPADNRIGAVASANRADNASGRSWSLSGYAESRFTQDAVYAAHEPAHFLSSAASAGFLQLANVRPQELGLASLRRASRYMRGNGLDDRGYRLAFWSSVARIAVLPVALWFALPFGFGAMRAAGSGARTTLGLGVALVYFFLQSTVESGAVWLKLDPVLLACLPTALLALVAAVLLWRTR